MILLQLCLCWCKNLITSWFSYTFKYASNFKHRVVLNDFRKTTPCLKLDAYLDVQCQNTLPSQLSWLQKMILTPFHCCGEQTKSQKTLTASMTWSEQSVVSLESDFFRLQWLLYKMNVGNIFVSSSVKSVYKCYHLSLKCLEPWKFKKIPQDVFKSIYL